nr:pneumococcal serine-rich repeat protein isoform X2 [Drosophila kikkawai]
MADADDSKSGSDGSGSASGSGRGSGAESLQLLTKLDKAVSTNDVLLDLQRALTYEAVFSTLVEHKMQALKRDYEEHKKAKRRKRKSIGRIFLPRKLFGGSGSRRSSREDTPPPAEEAPPGQSSSSSPPAAAATSKAKTKAKSRQDDIEEASGSLASFQRTHARRPENLEDSLASTLSNSSGAQRQPRHSHSLLVRAQTHTPAHQVDLEAVRRSSRSSSSEGEAEVRSRTQLPGKHSTTINGESELLPPISGHDNTSTTATATATVTAAAGVSGSVLHSSTLADDSLTASLRGSLESLSYSSSRCTVSFGGAEVMPSAGMGPPGAGPGGGLTGVEAEARERARLAKRLRILEAKSISAQCSPIFPRHVVRSFPLQAPQQGRLHINVPSSLAKPQPQPQLQLQQPHVALDIETLPAPLPQRRRLLPKQLSCTESGGAGEFGVSGGVGGAEAYSRYFSRQNTSEDSANVTVSTVLAQSDSQSLHATPSYANTPPALARDIIVSQERRKSRSAGLLAGRPPVGSTDVVIAMEGAEGKGAGGPRNRAGTRTLVPDKLHRMTSTSTGSSMAATGCCSAAKPKERPSEVFRPTMPSSAATTTAQSTGSDDEYRRRKRKYKRHHRCSDPALVYPTPNGIQHYVHVLGIHPDTQQPIQCPYGEDSPCDLQLDMDLDLDTDADKIDDLEQMVPSGHQRHRRKHRVLDPVWPENRLALSNDRRGHK